jgi:hypothetical protein
MGRLPVGALMQLQKVGKYSLGYMNNNKFGGEAKVVYITIILDTSG